MLTVKILDSVIQKQGKLVFLFQPVISLANLKLQTLSYSDLFQLLSVFPVHVWFRGQPKSGRQSLNMEFEFSHLCLFLKLPLTLWHPCPFPYSSSLKASGSLVKFSFFFCHYNCRCSQEKPQKCETHPTLC